VQLFDDSEALDACPKLRGRPQGPCSAVCVPVAVMGRTVGVIHSTGAVGEKIEEGTVLDLGTLANLAGGRIGLLRMVAETQLQAATDSLTGLLNRRSLEQRVGILRQQRVPFAVVMADLDHFKRLNDTYGHETGDRALRLFAQTLAGSFRSQDLVCRHGGEEFAVILPTCPSQQAYESLRLVQSRLAKAVVSAGLPKLTASFGVVEAGESEELAAALHRADVALFQAKGDGRDRIVIHDQSGIPVVVDDPPAPLLFAAVNGTH
jgi:diguanylate cyclase (GGDEF)-like protein